MAFVCHTFVYFLSSAISTLTLSHSRNQNVEVQGLIFLPTSRNVKFSHTSHRVTLVDRENPSSVRKQNHFFEDLHRRLARGPTMMRELSHIILIDISHT